MNSTRHWVTPPREPVPSQILLSFQLDVSEARGRRRTGAAENAGDLDELDGNPVRNVSALAILHGAAFQQRCSATHLAESILAEVDYVGGVGMVVWLRASSRYGSQSIGHSLY